MTKEQYDLQKEKIERAYQNSLTKLAEEYAFANNPYKVDDIVTDHIGSIQIKEIKISSFHNERYPCCVYRGIELKRDYSPKVKQENRPVWQQNIIKK